MTEPHVTKHARKRIERGDKHGLRTNQTIEGIVDLIKSPAAVKDGSIYYAYSEPDDTTLKVVTARQGRVIVTVYDTSREQNRAADMIARARAGKDPIFPAATPIQSYPESASALVCLGAVKLKHGDLYTNDLVEVGSYFGIKRDNEEVFTREFHEYVTTAADMSYKYGLVSKTAFKKLHTIVYLPIGFLFYIPIWVSYDLMQKKRPL